MDLIAQHQLDKASQIYYCVVKSVNNNQCTIVFNNKQYTVPYYGGKPTPNKTYAIFLPHNNMNESFVIGDGKDGGGGGSGSGIAIQPDPPVDGELVWIDTDDPGTTHIIPEIDDTQESTSDTWSSQKIASEITMKSTTNWETAYNSARSFIIVNFSESYGGDVRQFTIIIPKGQIISTNREFGDLVAFASTSDYSYVKVTCNTTSCTAIRYWYNGTSHYPQPDTVTFYYM